MAQSFSRILVHLIFSTKHREPLIDTEIRHRLHAYVSGIIRESGGEALLVGGTADHVHALMTLPATRSISEMVRLIKANSTKWIHETHPDHADFGWQDGYAAFSVSESNVAKVAGYIAGQELHHRKMLFQEEYLGFLRKHGVAVDERYVLD